MEWDDAIDIITRSLVLAGHSLAMVEDRRIATVVMSSRNGAGYATLSGMLGRRATAEEMAAIDVLAVQP